MSQAQLRHQRTARFSQFENPTTAKTNNKSLFQEILEQKKVLKDELHKQLLFLASFEDGWDGGQEKAPTKQSIAGASILGTDLVEYLIPPPGSLQVGCSQDGMVQFTLFGTGEAEMELWVSEDGLTVSYIGETNDGEDVADVIELRGAGSRIAGWLRGESTL